jgi:NAD(P) transhydrogenase subunit beta
MPGHMNVPLAEAECLTIRCSRWKTSTATRAGRRRADTGANDVVNPLAEQKGSAIYGMPIIEAHQPRPSSSTSGRWPRRAGLDNPFYMDKTMMVFGDAKKIVEELVKAASRTIPSVRITRQPT